MIVKCEQCQTKFKIPDDKVTDKGVKVRCTKCGHTFRVTKESGQAAGGAPTSLPPSGAFSPAAPTTRIAAPTTAVPLDSADPFSRFGAPAAAVPKDEQTRPGVFALGVEASRVPHLGSAPPPPTSSSPTVPVRVPQGAGSPFDFGSLAPPPNPSAPAPAAAPQPAPAAAAPFDFSSLMGPPSAGAPAPSAPVAPAQAPRPAPAAAPAPFDFSALTAPPEPPPPAPPPPRTSAPARPMDAPAMSFDFSSLGPPPAAAVAPAPAAAPAPMLPDLMEPPPPAPAPSSPAGAAPPALGDDFFASAPTQAAHSVPEGATEDEARRALFDMSAAAPPQPSAPAAVAPAEAPAPAAIPTSSPSNVIQLQRPPDPATERGRRALGIVVNVVIAAVLMIGLVVVATAAANEGKLDLQSVTSSLKALVTATSDFPAEDISNGLYETKMGRPVFFVRGVVSNNTGGATRVRVKAEILDGATLVRSAEVLAGAPATPEELNRIAALAEVKTLMERQSSKAPAVEAGGSAPFLVTFAEYPPDLKAFRVRVTATAEGHPTAAAAP